MKIFFPLLACLPLLAALPVAAQERIAGCLFDPAKADSVPYAAPLMRGDYNRVPKAASLKKYCPTPQDQANTGTCTAWAAAYAARTILMAQRKGFTNAPAVNGIAFSPSFVYNQIRRDPGCTNGAYLKDALSTLKIVGAVLHSEFGFDCNKPVSFDYKMRARNNAIQDFRRLFSVNETSDRSAIVPYVKKSLAEGKPVVTTIRYLRSLDNAKGLWTPAPQETSSYYHAVTLVGYDDNQYGGAFEMMNSWGTAWGNGGFIWVKYDDFQRICMEAYELIDFPAEIASVTPAKPDNTATDNTNFTKGFGATILLRQNTGEVMQLMSIGHFGFYRTRHTYTAGTRFQIQISNREQMYFYAFGIDSRERKSRLFPLNDNQSPLMGYQQSNMMLPSEDAFIEMDNSPGNEYLYLVYSRQPIQIDELIQRVLEIKGVHPLERLKQALREKNLFHDGDRITYMTASANFYAAAYTKTVPMVVEIRR